MIYQLFIFGLIAAAALVAWNAAGSWRAARVVKRNEDFIAFYRGMLENVYRMVQIETSPDGIMTYLEMMKPALKAAVSGCRDRQIIDLLLVAEKHVDGPVSGYLKDPESQEIQTAALKALEDVLTARIWENDDDA